MQQLQLRAVMAEFPEHHTSQPVLPDILRFLTERFRTVVAPEIFITPHRTSNSFGQISSPCRSRKGRQLSIAAQRLSRSSRGLIQSAVGAFHSRPSFSVEGNSQNDLFCRNTAFQKSAHGVIAISLVERRL